jgi:hemerythrin superfamily protein
MFGKRLALKMRAEWEERMDAFEKLMQDHRIAEQCLAEIVATTCKETERREQLFKELRAMLEAHETFEEEVLYPEIDQFPSTRLVVAEAFDEHAEFDAILQEIAGIPADRDDWIDRILEFKELLQKHVRAEEETMFPPARLEVDKSRAEELGRQIGERQNNL